MIDLVVPDTAWEDVDANAEALVDRWLVQEGDRVEAGHALVSIVLIKASFELPAPTGGVIERILVRNDQTFRRGQPLAVLRED